MADPDASIVAEPSALLAAAGASRTAASQLRAAAPASLEASSTGDPASADALRGALTALVQMVRVCGDGADDLAYALTKAHEAYAVSDAVAVPR